MRFHLLADLVHGALGGLVLSMIFLSIALACGVDIPVKFALGVFLVLIPMFMISATGPRNR